MELKNIVLHQIIREENKKPELNSSDRLLDINDITKDFITKLIKSYTSKSPTYGAFNTDDVNNPFQTSVKEYFEKKDFLIFSIQAMNTLKKAIEKPKATGGYVVFAHYIEKEQDFIVTVMLDNSESFVVNEKLGIEKLLGLDIDKVARANRINWQEWKESKETYLSFIKGTRGVSNYFAKDFIGCTDYTSSKENAKNLGLAISAYMQEEKFEDDKKTRIRGEVKGYTDRQIDTGEDIKIDAISAYLNPDDPTSFTEFIHENAYKVGDFKSTRKSDFKSLEIKVLKGDGYKLEYRFNSDNIELDKDKNRIVIKNVPDYTFED